MVGLLNELDGRPQRAKEPAASGIDLRRLWQSPEAMSRIKASRDSAGAVHHMCCIFDAEVMVPGQIAISLSLDASPDGSLPPARPSDVWE